MLTIVACDWRSWLTISYSYKIKQYREIIIHASLSDWCIKTRENMAQHGDETKKWSFEGERLVGKPR
ncbi:hypothetical protein HanIR_Chr09g0445281 [Helianthus annuus]|nr:hypothetical protein HanIR_Chr09g0445281 [Helianthus annuus]